MLNKSLLWRKVIDPGTGKIVKEETVLGAVLATSGIVVLLAAIAFLFL